jgi:hypothetical protein
MNLQEWRQAQATEATLPSGLEVTLRKVTLIDLAQGGRIPETLRPAVDSLLARAAKEGKPMTLADFEQFAGVVDLIVAAALVGPEGLTVAELPWPDRMAIYQWANEVSAQLATFRSKQSGALEATRARK